MSRASLAKAPADVARMFDEVAARYDLTNSVLSAGRDRGWRRAVVAAVGARPGELVLDLAAGTGTSSSAIAASGAVVIGCDFSLGMLRAGAARRGGASAGGIRLVAGDGVRLPFRDGAFDAVTISFGLRNVNDSGACLAELWRVTRPGGRLVVCEFAHPVWPLWRVVYLQYLMRALPMLARRVCSNPDAYCYLAESIRAWPDQPALARRLVAAGWSGVGWRNLTGGIVALHRAHRPGG
ncbi:MAG: demethylmenaquinone methyltransferase [Mycobacteriales bacterium]